MSANKQDPREAKLRRFNRYPTYKDSGVEWLGDVPSHWENQPLKRIFTVTNGSTPESGVAEYWNGDIPWVTPEDLGDLKTGEVVATRRSITESGYRNCGATLVSPGSLVLSTRAPIGHLAVARVALCTNQGCRCLVPRTLSEARYFYFTISAARSELESLGQGSTFSELAKSKLEGVVIPQPPRGEQRAIAEFLDRETARIDTLVVKKERLIDLLREERASIVTQAVTRGLDRNRPMKESGVEWLGDIPAHWQIKRLGFVLSEPPQNGLSPPIGPTGITPTFSIAAVRAGLIRIGDHLKYADARAAEAQRFLVSRGDVLVLRGNGNLHMVGSAGVVVDDPPEGCIYPDILIRLRPSSAVSSWYLVNALNAGSIRPQLETAAQTSAGVWKIAGGDLTSIRLPVPPPEEQAQIESEMMRQTARIRQSLAKTKDAIERLREFRAALITAAVTGQIDVREEIV